MSDAIIQVLIIVGAFSLIAWLSSLFRKRFNLQRFFTLPPVTEKTRAIAIIIAFIFGMAYLFDFSFLKNFHGIFLLIAGIALIYSFRKPQDTDGTS